MRRHVILLGIAIALGFAVSMIGRATPLRPERESSTEMVIVQLQVSSAEDIVDLLKSVYRDDPRMTVAAIITSNQVVVFADSARVREVRDLVQKVEEASARPQKSNKAMRLEDLGIVMGGGGRNALAAQEIDAIMRAIKNVPTHDNLGQPIPLEQFAPIQPGGNGAPIQGPGRFQKNGVGGGFRGTIP